MAVRRREAGESAPSIIDLTWPGDIRITPLREIAPELVEHVDDWEVLAELDRRGGVDGFITNDDRTLDQVREMAVLSRTRLVLIATHSAGHNPLRATGLLMVYLPEIAKRIDGSPRIYHLRANPLQAVRPTRQVRKLAERRRVSPAELFNTEIAAAEQKLGRALPTLPSAIGSD